MIYEAVNSAPPAIYATYGGTSLKIHNAGCIYQRFINPKPKYNLMEKCTACHWQCTEIRRCKLAHLPKGDIDPELLEGIEFKLPDSMEGI
jgi:hypothetical protein